MNYLIIFTAEYFYMVIIVIAIIAIIYETEVIRKNILKLSLFSLPTALILGKIANRLFADPRPFVVEKVQPLIAHSSDNGFPSDHTLLVMTVASIICVYNRKVGVLLFVLAGLVGVARVLAKVHHPIDILASTIISIISTAIVFVALRKYKVIT